MPISQRVPASRAVASAIVVLGFVFFPLGALAQDATSTPAAGEARRFELPGERVFPEGVAHDPRGGAFYVGSATDGTIFTGNTDADAGESVEVFSPAGADGRAAALGMKVDDQGRLFVAGGETGQVWVYDTASRTLLGQFDNRLGPNTFLNDLVVTASGDVYITDSFNPIIFRIAADAVPSGSAGATPVASPIASPAASPVAGNVADLEYFLDYSGSVVPFGDGFNLNGIVADEAGGVLVAVHTATGGLFRFDLAAQEVTEVDLGGGAVESGDGMALLGTTLYVVRNSAGLIVPVEMAADLTSGTIGEGFTDAAFAYPTTIAPYDGCTLVTNSQFDQRDGGQPVLPFTVVAVPLPGGDASC